MITEIFENLFQPISDEEKYDRDVETFQTMKEFFDKIDQLPEGEPNFNVTDGVDPKVDLIRYYNQHHDMPFNWYCMYQYSLGRPPAMWGYSSVIPTLYTNYKQWLEDNQ